MAERRTRRSFTREFKAQAVMRLLDGGKGLSEVATELGIGTGQLSQWRTEHLAAGSAEALAVRKAEQALLLAAIFRGPERARYGCTDWTLPALCRWLEDRFDKRLHPASLSRIVRRLELSRQKTRPLHPEADERAKAAFVKATMLFVAV